MPTSMLERRVERGVERRVERRVEQEGGAGGHVGRQGQCTAEDGCF